MNTNEIIGYGREMQCLWGSSSSGTRAKVQLKGHSLTQKAVSRIETGIRVVPDYEIPLLAEALGVDPLWLLGLSDIP